MAKRNRNAQREWELTKARAERSPRSCKVERCPSVAAPGKMMCDRHTMRRRLDIPDCEVWGCQKVGKTDGLCVDHRPVALTWRLCDECQARFTARSPKKLCSDKCRRRRNARQVRSGDRAKRLKVDRTVSCRECGMVALARDTTGERWRSRSVYCSRACMRRCIKREAKARRRQRKAGAGYETVYRRRVYERDGWVCQLCGKPVLKDSAVPNPMAPTLDHIVPLSAGGEHSYRNVQLAHFRCNTLRGDGGDVQLRLIA